MEKEEQNKTQDKKYYQTEAPRSFTGNTYQ